MKNPQDPAAPRAARAKAAPAPAGFSQELVYRQFADNPGKVLGYRQLSRRLGITTKAQRDELFDHLKVLRRMNRLELLSTLR